MFDRVCVPTTLKVGDTGSKYYKQISGALHLDKLSVAVGDLEHTKALIFSSVFISLLVGYCFLFLLRKCAAIVIWIFILFVLALMALAGLLFFLEFKKAQDGESTLSQANENPEVLIGMAIFFWFMVLILICAVCCNLKSIRIAIHIVECASRFIQENFSVLFVPIIFFVFLFIFFLLWFIAGVYLASTGEVDKTS